VPAPAKPVVTHVVPPYKGNSRRGLWRLVKRDIEHRLNLCLLCSTELDASTVVKNLHKIRKGAGLGFLIARRGTAVFVSHF